MRKSFWKGLRGIDLGIVLVVFVAIGGVVMFNYPEFKCRAMQSEAKFSLQEIFAAQKYFHAEFNHYATLDRLLNKDQRIKIFQRYYTLSDFRSPTDQAFSIVATGMPGTLVAGEQWIVNELKEIKLLKQVCAY
jgi:Tfp pilus assembly protein PilE